MTNVIAETFLAGDGTISFVVKKLSVTRKVVTEALLQCNINYKNPRIKIDDQTGVKILTLVSEGLSYRDVAKTVNLEYATVRSYCLKNGAKAKKHSNSLSLNLVEVLELAQKGLSKTKIGKILGVSRDSVGYFCLKNDISLIDKSPVRITNDQVIKTLERLKYDLVGMERKNNKLQVTALHLSCGKERSTSFWDFERHECPHCSYTGTSKGEEEIKQWIESLGFKTKKMHIDRKEIDIVVETPRGLVGIEYCGLYWHSEKTNSNKLRHKEKLDLCNSNGIRLLTIFEDEWFLSKKQVQNFIKSVLGFVKNRVYARDCEIKKVTNGDSVLFLNKNHIQGAAPVSTSFGLYHKDELIGLVTGHTHHRKKTSSDLVLNRLAFEDNVQVIGGSSKLLRHLIKYGLENNYDRIISWSDNRWSQGGVYKAIGFTLNGELPPDYHYTNGGRVRKNKQRCQKKHLLKMGGVGTTEKELSHSLGYFKIWDCGKKRWTLNLKDNKKQENI